MSFAATCVGFVALLSVTSARIIWNPLTTPTGDDRHKITFSRWATVDGRFNKEEGVWDGNQLGTQYVSCCMTSRAFIFRSESSHVAFSGWVHPEICLSFHAVLLSSLLLLFV